ncbi:sugar ABC transporter substrate-binding protein [Catenovulum adriaticum]|uniref:Sugar ABC transporter substrate-binding protein n=1 Tax=Catenovulum adriaticum TaxID=2984846 RepID=A0ABY7AR96_9ALTE|nr:sugar ABC transporter substrate-binding protein [Catenovulum sp. TS8]WAJ72009.1 sugar ABC transporter substrate-binding protein [Catenovulum sp. TS8]
MKLFKKFKSCCLLLSISLFTLTAYAKEVRVGLAVDQLFESRVAENNAIKAAAKKRGFQIIEVVADGDAQTQNAQIQSLISQRVDAILVCAVDQNTINGALMRAQRAGIPVIAYDRKLPNERFYQAYVGPDSVQDGFMAGQHMAKKLKNETGQVLVLELLGALNDQNGIDRSKGFKEALKVLPNVKIISVPTDWDSAKALSATQNAFQANPSIKAVFAATDTQIPSIETVLIGLDKAHPVGHPEHIVITGVNGSNDGYQATKKGFADGIVVMNLDEIGERSISLAEKLIKRQKVSKNHVVAGDFYSSENIADNKSKIWGASE